MWRWWLFLVVAGVVLVAPSAASAGGANHVVQVSANSGDVTAIRADVQAVPFGGQAATSANLASASSSDCTGCRAEGVAFQAVILTNGPNVVSPENAAVAVNSNCTGCDTFAFAYQYVVMVDGPASLSAAARDQLASIQTRADQIASSGEADAQLESDLRGLAAEFRSDIDQGLVLHGQSATRSEQLAVQAAG